MNERQQLLKDGTKIEEIKNDVALRQEQLRSMELLL